MTKITGIYHGNPISPKQETKGTDAGEFQKTLDKALNEEATDRTAQSAHNGILGEIQAIPPASLDDHQQSIEGGINQLIDMLDKYRKDLADPDKTLRDIEPILSALKKHADELMEKAHQEGADASLLNEIATEAAMAANVEFIKFRRGDYI